MREYPVRIVAAVVASRDLSMDHVRHYAELNVFEQNPDTGLICSFVPILNTYSERILETDFESQYNGSYARILNKKYTNLQEQITKKIPGSSQCLPFSLSSVDILSVIVFVF